MNIPDMQHERKMLLKKIKRTRVGTVELECNGSDDHIKYVTKRPEGDFGDDFETITTLVAIQERLKSFIQRFILTANGEGGASAGCKPVFVWQIDTDQISVTPQRPNLT